MKLTFQTHHIDGNDKNDSPSNLVKICGSCHTITFTAKTPKEARESFKKRHRKVSHQVKTWKNTRRKRKMWSYVHNIRAKTKT